MAKIEGIPPFWDEQKAREQVREKLAAYAHEAWAGWMQYMFGKTKHITNEVTLDDQPATLILMPTALYNRWQYQMSTDYADLPDDMKPSNRDEADKMLAILKDGGMLSVDPDDVVQISKKDLPLTVELKPGQRIKFNADSQANIGTITVKGDLP